jgi:hypothetical protein
MQQAVPTTPTSGAVQTQTKHRKQTNKAVNVCPATHVVAAACARHNRGILLVLHERVK